MTDHSENETGCDSKTMRMRNSPDSGPATPVTGWDVVHWAIPKIAAFALGVGVGAMAP